MRKLVWTCVVAMFGIPMAGLADVSGTPTLPVGTMLNLDTGATGSSGGDLLWTGTSLVPQPGVGTFAIPGGGAQVYSALTQALVTGLPVSNSPIALAALTPNAVFAFKTKSGNVGKMLVVSAAAGGPLNLQFTTYGTTGTGGGGPTITSIQNNYGQVPPGLPNYGIAPSTLFFIQGSGLANTTTDLQSSASPGLQTTLSGVTVNVTVGGKTVQCPLYYLSPTQIDAVLPGSTPTGTGTVTVTNNGATSAAASIVVVPSAFGILFYNGSLAAAYDANNALLTVTSAANPNQAIVLWGSGVGADPSDDDKLFPQKQNNLANIPMQAFVGGVEATIAYRGRSQYPGVDQVVLTIPSNVPTGCYVSVAIVSGNIVSNPVTIPIAASGRTCSDANTGLTADLIQSLNGKTTVRAGFLAIDQLTLIVNGSPQVSNTAVGSFAAVGSFSGGGSVSVGSCLLSNSLQTASATSTPLDAGSTITVTGPGGSLSLTQTIAGQVIPGGYFPSGTVPASFIPASGGSFTFDNGSGGKDVQHFNATLNVPAAFTWGNQAQVTAVTRSQGVNVTWSGRAPGSFVNITGSSSSTIGGKVVSVSFVCQAPISAGQFTVPVSVLLALPAGNGSLSVGNFGASQTFTAGGLDLGILGGGSQTSKTLTYN